MFLGEFEGVDLVLELLDFVEIFQFGLLEVFGVGHFELEVGEGLVDGELGLLDGGGDLGGDELWEFGSEGELGFQGFLGRGMC